MTSIYDAWDCGDRHEIRKQFAEREQKAKASSCPHCGSVEFDLIKFERGHEGRGWFNRCYRCETEWDV